MSRKSRREIERAVEGLSDEDVEFEELWFRVLRHASEQYPDDPDAVEQWEQKAEQYARRAR